MYKVTQNKFQNMLERYEIHEMIYFFMLSFLSLLIMNVLFNVHYSCDDDIHRFKRSDENKSKFADLEKSSSDKIGALRQDLGKFIRDKAGKFIIFLC